MLKDKDRDLDEMEEETTEAFDYADRDDRSRMGPAGSSPGGSLLKPILIAAVGLMLLIIVLLVLSSRGRNDIKLEEKVAALEAKIAQMEGQTGKWTGLSDRLAALEQEQASVKDFVSQLNRNQQDIGSQLQGLAREVESASRQAARPAAPKAAAKPAPAPKAAAKPAATASSRVYTVEPGDTLYRIGLKHNLSVDKLRQLNGLTAQDVIQPGQKLKVSP
ncbi:LysM peptidoglycan-binding domain-containing protein [Desulfatiglans anilini]|uniref:LysM peptidoglycan-binding domain-containing protein n=1 Tax=Desulfatiglans anilini TaxID=90728 RepID=UPI0004229F46|nr:LysM domain-containing protein [Desulfatiglans anilini]